MAIGKSYEKIDLKKIKIFFGNQQVTSNGMVHPNYSEEKAIKYSKNKEINITIDLEVGDKSWSVYTCDLTEQYIKINADYRS